MSTAQEPRKTPQRQAGSAPEGAGARDTARPATTGASATSTAAPPATYRRTAPRRVRLTLSRIDTWSLLKIAFLLSVAVAIASVVLVATLWTVLAGLGTFSAINSLLKTLDRQGSTFNVLDYVGFGRTVSFSIVIGVLNVVLMTAIATLSAFLYNICASLVGGVQLTLSDE